MKAFRYFPLFFAGLVAAVSVTSCKSGQKAKLLPNVSGKAGEIVVVIERDAWEGAMGGEIRFALASDCPYLAQREPLFTLANVPPGNFNNMFKVHRNILIMNVNPQNVKEGILYEKDQWASPQAVVQVNAATVEAAVDLIHGEGPTIAEFFEQAERDRIVANARLYEELSLREPVEKLTGGTLPFPNGYKLKKQTQDFLWIADEKQYTNQAVLIYRYPASKGDNFTLDAIISKRNEVLEANVPGMFENTYMTTASAIEPTIKSLKYKDISFMETRGFWEVHNDFMGGPFVSHSFYSPDGSDIIVLEAFIYAPKYDKRQYLRQVESLLYAFSWKKN